MAARRKRDPREGRRYRTLRADFLRRARIAGAHCWLAPYGYCVLNDAPIDWDAHGRTPHAPELDHALPCSTHPHLAYEHSNFRVAHAKCNQSRGAKNPLLPRITEPAAEGPADASRWQAASW